MTDERDRSVTYADARGETIDHAKERVRQERQTIDTLLTAYSASKGTSPGNMSQFLRGVMCGLQMGEFAVEDMDSSVMRAPDPAAKEVLDDDE